MLHFMKPPHSFRLRRSSFIATASAALAGVVVMPSDPSGDDWLRHPAFAALGSVYVSDHPSEADEWFLRRALFGTDSHTKPAEIRRLITICSARDVAAADFVLVDRWILARSEARVCALAYLIATRDR
jgi:hypothetical protein